jgi:tetratricopeptide (TPR) repeat protein
MNHARTFFTLIVAAGLAFAGSRPAVAQLGGKRNLGDVKKMGERKGMSKEEAAKKTEARMITAADISKAQENLRKLASAKEDVIRQQIGLMEQNLKLADTESDTYPDYLFRVAEHYNAMRMNQWQTAMAMYDKIFQAEQAGNKALAAKMQQQQKLLFERSEWWLKKALVQYVRITSVPRYAKYSRMDEVIFTVGDIAKTLAEEAGKRKDSAKQNEYSQVMLHQFSRLTKEFPRSRFIPDALLAKGEYFFNNRQMTEAIEVYQKVAKYTDSPLAPYAEYKIGWCYLNLKQYREALSKFTEVAKGSKGGKTLIQSAQKDVVRAYTHIGKPDKAYEFFGNVAKGDAGVSRMMFLLLGVMYYGQGKNIECIQVFKEALAKWPKDRERCQWVTTMVDATINVGDKGAMVKSVQWLGRVTQDLTKQLGAKAPEVVQCRSSTENTIKMLATQWHAEGLKTKNMDTLGLTRSLYEEYLKTYPESPVFYLMSYQYADLMWFFNEENEKAARTKEEKAKLTGDWLKLGKLFTSIVKLPKPKDLKQEDFVGKRNDAALAAVRCYMFAFNVTDDQITGVKKTGEEKECLEKKGNRCTKWGDVVYKPQPIPEGELAMLDAFNTYIQYVPTSTYLPAIVFNTGHIYWKHNHFDKAMPLFMKVAMEFQKQMAKAGRVAAYRIVGMLIAKKDFKGMREYVDKFLQQQKLMEDDVFKAQMHEFKVKAMWADADDLRTRKKWAECGSVFEQMATGFAESKDTDAFFWNAGACYENAGMLGPAVAMRRSLIQKFPKSKHAAMAMYYVAGNYHNLAFFADAAKWYELFFEKHASQKEAADSLMWGIVLRGGLGDESRMMKNAASFIEKWRGSGKKKDVAKSFWLVVKLYEDQGVEDKHMVNLMRYVRDYGTTGDIDRFIEANSRLGEMFWQKSCKVKMTDGLCIRINFIRRKGMKKKQKVVYYLERDRRTVATAKRYFDAALQAWAGGKGLLKIEKDAPGKTMMFQNARHWAAHAAFMQAEFKFEDYMKLDLPSKLDFDPKYPKRAAESAKKFAAWVQGKMKSAEGLIKQYLEVIVKLVYEEKGAKRGDPHWSIASVARAGQIFHNFADLLLNAEVPKFLTSYDAKDAYKAELEKFANPLLFKAQDGYKKCLGVSNNLRWFNNWSRLCEREINRLEPDKYPLANEQRAQPGYLSTSIDKADFQFGVQ